MKKLLDETSDELTRSLLLAARAHRPPARSRARLLVALGAAGSLGLFSSKAFAWLGTSAGKLTLLGVGVAVAGGAYALADAPVAEPARVAVLSNAPAAVGAVEPVRSPAVAPAPGSAAAAPAAPPGAAASAETLPTSVPASVADSSVPSSRSLSRAMCDDRSSPSCSGSERSCITNVEGERRYRSGRDVFEQWNPKQNESPVGGA